MITLGLVDSVDDNGVYVTMPGSRGLLRGPFQTLQNVTAGDRVLVVRTDDGEDVIVGQAAASASGVVDSAMIANGTIVNEDINASAAIAVSKLAGHPTSTTDNTVPRFDGTGGGLQTSGVTISDGDIVGMSGASFLGSSSGAVSLSAPAAAGTTSLTLPLYGFGKVLQVVAATYSARTTNNTVNHADTGLTATITPASSSSKILVLFSQNGCGKEDAAGAFMALRLLRASSALMEQTGGYTTTSTVSYFGSMSGMWLDSPATASAVTYKTTFARAVATGYVVVQDGSSPSTMTLIEIGP